MRPFAPDWRRRLELKDSPWYPTARLFRKQMRRDWRPVAAAIREELEGD
jgi:hypothetical protein